MNPQRWKQVDSILQSVLDRAPEQRDAFLQQACAGDSALEREVRSLMTIEQRAGTFLEQPAMEVAARKLADQGSDWQAGATFSHYRILGKIGEGGMGAVYKAEDTRLHRFVALKVLSGPYARDPDALNRFQREARAASALNHASIVTLHDIANDAGVDYLVMEYVEGKSLDKLITSRGIPQAEAIGYAAQIASALAVAHAAGIVHRDIKPANLVVTPTGQLKILDFGLAKLTERVYSKSQVATAEMSLTQTGTIMGTVAYMSPEQASGQEIDHRSDIFSLGIVTYEMLAGRRPFEGKSQVDLLHAVIHDPAPPAASIPPRLREILDRALVKDPNERYQHAGDLAIDLKHAPEIVRQPALPSSKRAAWITWALTGAVALLLAALAALGWAYFRQKPPVEQSVRYQISPPGPAEYPALSPDGRYLAFVTNNGGPNQIWIRAMDALESRPLAGTEGATYPFWSPDGAYLGFFTGGKLKKIALAGGGAQLLCDATTTGRGGTWNRDDVILFSPGPASPIFRVPAAGGTPVAVTKVEGRSSGHRFPIFLPDGVHFLYNAGSDKPADSGIFAGSLTGTAPVRLLPDVANPLYSPPAKRGGIGYLLFRHADTLTAAAFDAERLKITGDLFPLAEQVPYSVNTGFGAFTVSGNGILAFHSGPAPNHELVWMNRAGKRLGTFGKPSDVGSLAVSPDEKTVAVWMFSNGSQSDIWLQDIGRDVSSRFTFRSGYSRSPIWSTDGSRLIYAFEAFGAFGFDIFRKPIGGNGQEELLFGPIIGGYPDDWSSDGKWIVYHQVGDTTANDLWLLPLNGEHKPVLYLQTPFDESDAQFSPDGKWMAYQSNESGRYQVYVQSIPPSGAKYQISPSGGTVPHWRRDGKELFYVAADRTLMAVSLKAGAAFEVGTPQPLFPVPVTYRSFVYSPMRDGQRFLVSVPEGSEAATPITVVTNWQQGLKK